MNRAPVARFCVLESELFRAHVPTIARFLAEVSGRLTVGRRADLSAFVLDPLTAPPDEFAESPVPLTVVDGAVAHRADH